MRKLTLCVIAAAAVAAYSPSVSADNLRVASSGTELVLKAEKGKELKIVYFGAPIAASDAAQLRQAGSAGLPAYPAYGLDCPSEAAIAVTHADGNMSTQLLTDSWKQYSADGASFTEVLLRDSYYPFEVKLCYKVWDDSDMIETWTEISNLGKKPVTLREFKSVCLPIRRGDVWMSHFSGLDWADECHLTQEPVTPGLKVIKSREGIRNTRFAHAEIMFSLDGKPQENSGRTIGAALCYGGNYELKIDTERFDWHTFFAGINEDNSEYKLEGKETFTTPVVALTYSDEGLGGVSRNFHRWARKHRLAHGETLRKILLNSWEGVYFDVNEEGMDRMMADIASMGGELFVMDDGWFGVKYPRSQNNCGLGDWTVDTQKLPHGVPGLVECAKKHGVKFGIWIEPEMTNSISELYEKHPDWVITSPNHDVVYGRGGTQMVLDLSNPKVQDFVFGVVDNLMKENPELDYIKWDANTSMLMHGSEYLPADRQSHLNIEYYRGFAKVCERIRAKYPDLTIQACASGGGRVNYGILPWFDEFWASDNTDALQRVYIHWGTSYFFPAIAMGSHISAVPNHQTYRTVPLKYRIDVAMSGRLGMEIQPANMTEEEKEICRRAIADYKTIRPVVQLGDIYRLVSPYDGHNLASLMYCSEDKSQAAFFWWKLETLKNDHLPRVRMAGLDPEKSYKVHELNRIDNKPLSFEGCVFSGRFLMEHGLEIPQSHNVDKEKRNDWSSRVLYLTAE